MLLKTRKGLVLLSTRDGVPSGPASIPEEGTLKYGLVNNGMIVTTYDDVDWRIKAGIAWASPEAEGQLPHPHPHLQLLPLPLPSPLCRNDENWS